MMTHDQEIESHPFFKKHFAGKSTKEYHEIPHDGGSAGYHQWTAHHGIGLTPVKHKLFHRYHPETNSHSVLLTTGTEGKNILGNHIYHSGEGEGSSATEALEKTIHAYKNDHGFHLQENVNQFNLKEGHKPMKDFRDFVKTTYAGLMEMANERTEILYGPRAEIHTIKTGKIKHTLRYVGNNHYVTTPSSEKHDVQRTHYSLDDALDHLRKQGHQISKTDLHLNNKTPIVKESNMKDFKDFVKTTYASRNG